MKLLRNHKEFFEFSSMFSDNDICEEPLEYPCWVYRVVINWNLQYEEAVYLYKSDMKKMLEDMDKTDET